MNQVARFSRWFTCALALGIIPAARADKNEESNPLEPLSRFVGGSWIGEGKHGTDSGFRTRVVYEWGVSHRLLKAKSYLQGDKGEQLVYESVFAWHPEKKKVIFLSVSAAGGIFEGTLETKDDTFESLFNSYSASTTSSFRQTIQFLDNDHTLWTVFMKKGADWLKVIESKQHREKYSTQPGSPSGG